jgi:dCTP diphosphatase
MEIAELQKAAVTFARHRRWELFHNPKNLAMALASEVGELNAVLRWVSSESSDEAAARPDLHVRIRQEIGDVAILLLLLCDRAQIDLSHAVLEKLQLNARNYPTDSSVDQAERPSPAQTRSADDIPV